MFYHSRTRTPSWIAGGLILCLLSLLAPVSASAQSGGPFDLSWSTVDCGGITFGSGDVFTLGGTVGQPDAGIMSNGSFSLSGGFWSGGAAETSGVDPAPPGMTTQVRLLGHAPNPFDTSTTIGYELPVGGTHVRIQVFDTSGREVAVLVDDFLGAGRHAAVWSGRDGRGQSVPSGVYFYRFEAGSTAEMRKIILME